MIKLQNVCMILHQDPEQCEWFPVWGSHSAGPHTPHHCQCAGLFMVSCVGIPQCRPTHTPPLPVCRALYGFLCGIPQCRPAHTPPLPVCMALYGFLCGDPTVQARTHPITASVHGSLWFPVWGSHSAGPHTLLHCQCAGLFRVSCVGIPQCRPAHTPPLPVCMAL